MGPPVSPRPSQPAAASRPGGSKELGEEEMLLDMDAIGRRVPLDLRRANSSAQAANSILSSYVSRRFMSGCAILFPLVVTLYLTWWCLEFFDNFFSPVYEYLFGFQVFGLGFITTMVFIFSTGVFTSSWIGTSFVGLGEYIIRKVPLVKHIYGAAKQISAAVSPDEATNSFRECVLVRHPRHGEYAFGFITGQTLLQSPTEGDLELFCVYIPTNHVYVGDIFLMGAKDIIRNNLSVREGIEIVVSVGMAVPPLLVGLPPGPGK